MKLRLSLLCYLKSLALRVGKEIGRWKDRGESESDKRVACAENSDLVKSFGPWVGITVGIFLLILFNRQRRI